MATLECDYVLFAADDLPRAWPGDDAMVPDPDGADFEDDSLVGSDASDRADDEAHRWHVCRFNCVEAVNTTFRCELTLALFRPLLDLSPEARRNRNANDPALPGETGPGPDTAWDELRSLSTATLTPASDFRHYVLEEEDPQDIPYAISAPIAPSLFIGRRMSVAVVHRTKGDDTDPSVATGRFFSGVVTEFEDLGNSSVPEYRLVNVVIEPSLAKLRYRQNCRIFQNLTAVQIIEQIFKEAGIYADDCRSWFVRTSDESTRTNAREYCVQYNETDFDFVTRLLSEEALNYCFDHGKLCDRIVFVDDFGQRAPVHVTPSDDTLTVTDDPAQAATHNGELAWEARFVRRLAPQKARVRDYNYFDPYGVIEQTADWSSGLFPTNGTTTPENYRYPGGEQLQAFSSSGDGSGTSGTNSAVDDKADQRSIAALTVDWQQKRYDASNTDIANAMVDAQRATDSSATVKSNCVSLVAGSCVTLSGSFAASKRYAGASPTFVLAVVRHWGYPPLEGHKDILHDLPTSVTSGDIAADPKAGVSEYFNSVDLIDPQGLDGDPVRIRPAPAPAPKIYGLQSAVVVDPSDDPPATTSDPNTPFEKIACDELGRVKIRFDWDRREDSDYTSASGTPEKARTAWVRLAQPWAGHGFGVQFVPRVGMEVAVTFVDGDPDQPIIVGTLYNGTHVPWTREERDKVNDTRNGFRTRAYPVDDDPSSLPSPGYHELSFDDQKDHQEILVRSERHLTEHFLHTHITEVVGNQTNTVHGDHVELIHGPQYLTVFGDRNVMFDKAEFGLISQHRVTTIVGDETIANIGGRRQETVFGDPEAGKPADDNKPSKVDPSKPVTDDGKTLAESIRVGKDENDDKIRSLKAEGSRHVEVWKSDTLQVDDRKRDSIKGALNVKAAGVKMTSSPGQKGDDDPNKKTLQMSDDGVSVDAKGSPGKIEIVSHDDGPNAADYTKDPNDPNTGVTIAGDTLLHIKTEHGVFNANTKGGSEVRSTKDLVEFNARERISLAVLDEEHNQGRIVMTKGALLVQFHENTIPDENPAKKDPKPLFEILLTTSLADDDLVLHTAKGDDQYGVDIEAANVDMGGVAIMVNGSKGINVQKGGKQMRLLSGTEEKALKNALDDEKHFKAARKDAADASDKRLHLEAERDKSLDKLNNATADFRKAEGALQKALAEQRAADQAFNAALEEFEKLTAEFVRWRDKWENGDGVIHSVGHALGLGHSAKENYIEAKRKGRFAKCSCGKQHVPPTGASGYTALTRTDWEKNGDQVWYQCNPDGDDDDADDSAVNMRKSDQDQVPEHYGHGEDTIDTMNKWQKKHKIDTETVPAARDEYTKKKGAMDGAAGTFKTANDAFVNSKTQEDDAYRKLNAANAKAVQSHDAAHDQSMFKDEKGTDSAIQGGGG